MDAMPLEELLKPRPSFGVHVPEHLIAAALWDYGEDALAERALSMSQTERHHIEKIMSTR